MGHSYPKLIVLTILFVLQSVAQNQKVSSYNDDCMQVQEVKGDVRSNLPWMASIYARINETSPYKFLVSGIIVGSKSVYAILSTPPKGSIISSISSKYLVVAGIRSTNLNKLDKYAQSQEVVTVDSLNIHKSYSPVILKLKTSFNFTTPYVKPICIGDPRTLDKMPLSGWNYLVGGFTYPRGKDGGLQLKYELLNMKSKEYCDKAQDFYYKTKESDLYCGVMKFDENTKTPYCFTHGASSFIYLENSGLFTGTVTLIPSRKRGGKCTKEALYFFIRNQSSLLKWIHENKA